MSTEYEPKLIIGADLDELFTKFNKENPDMYPDKYDYRESELLPAGMEGEFMCGSIGFELPIVVKSDDWSDFHDKVIALGREFKAITGVPSKIKACVLKY